MGIFQQFPYSNFHEMNLDQIIKIMKEMQDEWAATKTEWASYKDFINNYFDNLDVSEEVLSALRTLADSGELNRIIDPTIVEETAAWLAQHITQPTTPAIDNTLSVAGAAADAKAAGDFINDIYNQIKKFNFFNLLENPIRQDKTQNGITFTWIDEQCRIQGNASGNAFDNLVSSQSVIPDYFENAFVGQKLAGYYSGEKSKLELFCYDSNGVNIYQRRQTGFFIWDIPANTAGVIIRLYVENGTLSVDETVSFSLITLGSLDQVLTNVYKVVKYNPDETATDLNNFQRNTIALSTGSHTNSPVNRNGFVLTLGLPDNTGFIFQLWIDIYRGYVFTRYRNNGGTWYQWASPVSEYTGSQLNVSDLNTLMPNTIQVTPASAANSPLPRQGIVNTIGWNDAVLMQTWTDYYRGFEFYRYRTIGGTWSDWTIAKYAYLADSSNITDLDDAPANSVLLTTASYSNMPLSRQAFVTTMGWNDTFLGQKWLDIFTGQEYYRYRQYNVWSDWILQSSKNAYAKMLSFGNSILNGSVWLNGSYDHLSDYNNAPYGIIANALDIDRMNVDNTLLDSTGLLYDAGQGNFTSHIKAVDTSDYDVVLTHIWVSDMNNYQVGSLSSVAGDGSIIGAIKDILNWIRTNDRRTYLIICSVPPSSTVISGNTVYTGTYPNGSSINDLDVLLHQLEASEEGLVVVDFEEWQVSKYYHDYTDGNNVHLNNEDTYRSLGAYAAGRAASKLTF